MLQTSNDDKDIGNVNDNAMYFAVNFRFSMDILVIFKV